MIGRVQELASLLRANGVRVSTAEVIDASRALDAVGVGDPGATRAALRASLVKREGDARVFDELFDLYFLGASAGAGQPLAAELREAGWSEAEIAALLERMAREAAGLPAAARAGLGMTPAEVSSLLRAAGLGEVTGEMVSPLQVGYFTYRLLEGLDMDGAAGEVTAMLRRLVDEGVIDAAQYGVLEGIYRRNASELRDAVRRHVEASFRTQNLDYMEELTARALADKPLAQLTDSEIDQLRSELRRLARVLRARVSLKPKVRRRGRLDLRRTLRGSLATGGIPFRLVRRERERRKPRLVILCDVSESVRNVSRFMLQLVYTLQELFDRVDSFAFVSELGELTELFRSCDIDRALDLTYAGKVVNVFANSNYGRALRQFADRHMDRVTPRTTVLVLGDGRNNYHPAHASVLGDIRRRARQVWWLNPESPAAWGFGDSAMHEYRAHCDRVVVVRNLTGLRRVIDELVM